MARAVASIKHSRARLRDGRDFHVVMSGSEGPKVLFVHGYIDSWRSFEGMFPFLSKKFVLVAIDQRGHGETDQADRYDVEDFVGDVMELIASKSREPVHVVGHSLGAIVAHRLAARRRDLVLSVTLIGGAVSSAGNAGLTKLYGELKSLADPIPYEFAYEFQKSTTFQPLPNEVLNAYVGESMKVRARVWKAALRGLIEDAAAAGTAPDVPALVLWGEHDEVFPLADQLRVRKWMPNASFINYPDLGHAPQWEDPRRVSADVDTFISGVEEARGRKGT
jgi:pimeloyl-ACP methyl ester carboxylesterase